MSKVILKNRRLAAANSKWNVYLDHIEDAHGNDVSDYLVVAGHHPAARGITGVAVLPIVDGNFVLLRNYRHAIGSEIWELPRGFIDEQEAPATAALRELTEETNLRCSPEDLVPLGLYAPEPATMTARGALFAAKRCEGTPKMATDEIGLGRLHVLKPAAMADLIASGEVEDAGTLIAYFRYCAMARSNG